MMGPCHTDGTCCGPGSYCCRYTAPHEHHTFVVIIHDEYCGVDDCTCDGTILQVIGPFGLEPDAQTWIDKENVWGAEIKEVTAPT